MAQEFVIGGYAPGAHGFDAVILGSYRGGELRFCASEPSCPPAKLQVYQTGECPFVNLLEGAAGRRARA